MTDRGRVAVELVLAGQSKDLSMDLELLYADELKLIATAYGVDLGHGEPLSALASAAHFGALVFGRLMGLKETA